MDDLVAWLRARLNESFDERLAYLLDSYGVDEWGEGDDDYLDARAAESELRLLAATPYADRPGYRDEWAPAE